MADARLDGASVATAYDAWAAVYDTNDNPTRDLDAAILRDQPFDLAGRNVLEIGCGTGKNTAWLDEHADHVTALDFSPAMLEIARRRLHSSSVTFVQHDILTPWPLGDGTVDFVIGNLVLEHIQALRLVFEQTQRVLRPGGLCYFCELHPFRQLGGGQAQFVEPASGKTVLVAAYRHDVGDYVNNGLEAGLRLSHLGEWRDGGRDETVPPRLVSVTFVKPNLDGQPSLG